MRYAPKRYNRKSIRLPGYDYGQAGYYFITLSCKENRKMFGEVVDGEMKLNSFGEIVKKEWQRTSKLRNNVALHEFVVMPNHFHGIIEILFNKGNSEVAKFKSPIQTIGSIVRGFKNASIKKIKEHVQYNTLSKSPFPDSDTYALKLIHQFDFKIWHRNYFEVIIRNQYQYITITNYIINNPSVWSRDKYYR